ncbi:MAG: AAA family ATPase [Candidatus Methanoperedens sp.]|nr:AAA family ATPase [Candidatus Methanoperedens sp.]
MIITNIKLNPFGGLINKEIDFEKGLNVIIGPNEAGKSTIFNAIQKVFFTPSKLDKRAFKNEIERFIPLGGGDTIKVELQFLFNGETFTLKRTWGASPSSELVLPKGTLTNEDAIVSKLESLLPAKEGTYKSVLMTYQSGLSKTLDDLIHDPETLYSLGDIIRRSILETDGVSIDRFKQKIDKLFIDHFSRWDNAKNFPEKGRGIENPWKKDVGYILESYYENENVKSYYESALEYENNLDEINQSISNCQRIITEKQTYLQENKKAVEAARKLQRMNAELEAAQLKIKTLSDVNNKWPVLENEITKLERESPQWDVRLSALKKEKEEAEQLENKKKLLEKFGRVDKRKKELEVAEKEFESIMKLTDDSLEVIRDADATIKELKASIGAGKLTINFTPKRDLTLDIQKDLEDSYFHEVKGNETIQFEAGGRLKIEHSDWALEVASGKESVEINLQNYKEAEKKLHDLFEEYGVESLDAVIELNKSYNRHFGDVKSARKNLDDELGTESYEELENKIHELGPEKKTRPVAVIVEELVGFDKDIEKKKEELTQSQEQIRKYINEYESKENLLTIYAEAAKQKKDASENIKALAPLLENTDDIDLFIEKYEKTSEELESEKENRTGGLLQRAELEKNMPEQSAEEFKKQLAETEEQFQAVLRKGKAIARIKDMAFEISEQMNSGLYDELKNDLEKFVSALTNGRYAQVELEEGLPQGFIRDDGELLTYELLSAGTKDVLAMALRLSMAGHFLKNADGFLIMDDPLVDLDPERQKKAAELLRKYAEEKQILIFTCHPSHAELLEGHQIML